MFNCFKCDNFVIGAGAWNVTIVTNPVGIQVDNQINTYDFPLLTNVTLMCMVAQANVNVISYHWTAMDCYNHSKGVDDPCFYSGNKTGQNYTGYDLLAQDAGTVTCTAIIDGVNYDSDPLTLRISGKLVVHFNHDYLTLICLLCLYHKVWLLGTNGC